MGKTRRHEPQNGEFKKLRANKKQRTKKQRASKAKLRRCIKFASEHKANIDMTQLHASLYMEEEQHCCDHTKEYCEQHRDGDGCNMVAGQINEPNAETMEALNELSGNTKGFETVEELMQDLNE